MNQTIKGILIGLLIAGLLVGAYFLINQNIKHNEEKILNLTRGNFTQGQINGSITTINYQALELQNLGYLPYYQFDSRTNSTYMMKLIPDWNWTILNQQGGKQ